MINRSKCQVSRNIILYELQNSMYQSIWVETGFPYIPSTHYNLYRYLHHTNTQTLHFILTFLWI